jgi:TolB-like protein/Tfp pilus assembly protein PilF
MPNKISKFWQELKRRNLIRVISVYAATAFIIMEAADIMLPRLGLPDWTPTLVIIVLLAGFPLAIIFAWIFDITPEGLEKTRPLEEIPEGENQTVSNSWKIATFVSGVVIVGLILFNIFYRNRSLNDQVNPVKYIAVLPFENLSYDTSQLWFTEGISDVISSQLSKVSGLRVINRQSTLKYRERRKSISEIGEELGVEYLIDGSVQKQGKRIRIIPKLVSVKDKANLWSDVYDKDIEEIFDVQTDIAKRIAVNLQTMLSPEETQQIENIGTSDFKALELYLKGNFEIRNLGDMAPWRAIEYYKQSIDQDSGFALPYAGMAHAYFTLTSWAVTKPDLSLVPVAKEWALKALELDENLGEPHYFLGAISYMHETDWEKAEREFKAGMERNPNYVQGLSWYSNMLSVALRRFEEAISLSELIIELDPMDPIPYLGLALPLMYLGQWEKAFELLNKSLELHPDLYLTKRGLCLYYLKKGVNFQYIYEYCEERLKLFDNDLQRTNAFVLGDVGYFMTLTGSQDEAAKILNELIRRIEEGEGDVSYLWTGIIFNIKGESDKAIDFLWKGYEVEEPFLNMINTEITLESLRSNKRYQDLLRKMGFEI